MPFGGAQGAKMTLAEPVETDKKSKVEDGLRRNSESKIIVHSAEIAA